MDWSMVLYRYYVEHFTSVQTIISNKIIRERLKCNISIEKRQRKNQIEFIDRHFEWINFVSCNMRAEYTQPPPTYMYVHYNLTN